jgi:uncharacterized protein with PIN domain
MLRALILRLFPGMGARFEAESREWMVQCQKCSHEISVWEAGGIRYKARGTVRRLGKCSNCGRVSWLRIYRRTEPDPG